MTLDAMDWVWKHSRTSGNPRTVLLAVADAVTGPEAEARMGTAEVMRRLNVARSTARAAVAAALDSGELAELEAAKGSRATLYRIPGAVGYVRAMGPDLGPSTGPNLGPLTPRGPESGPPTGPNLGPLASTGPNLGPLSATGPNLGPSTGPESGPLELWDEDPEKCATRARASSKAFERVSEGVSEGAPASLADPIPPFARPLVDQITAADVFVGWDLTAGEWLRLDAMLKRSGADMLARHAVTLAARQRVSSARYFLRAWTALPPAPTAGTVPAQPAANVIPLDRDRAQPRSRVAQSADYLAEALAAMEAQQ